MLMTKFTFHHIGIACSNIEKTLSFVRILHTIKCETSIIYDPNQDANLCLLEDENGLKIELVSGAAVHGLIKKGISYYHHCYEVPDIQVAIEEAKTLGCILIRKPLPAVLFDNRKVCFMISPLGVIEFLEKSNL